MHPIFKIVVKIIMAAMLFGCLLKWQYSYYQILRWIVCGGFLLFGYKEYEEKRLYIALPCFTIAILFNPLAPIHLDRETWLPIDISIGVTLVVWIIADTVTTLSVYKKRKK